MDREGDGLRLSELMIISHKHKFIFIAVGKTGTTSIEKILEPFNEISIPKHTRLSEVKKLSGIDPQDYFTFCFTRNPWERAVSIYFQHRKPNNLQDPPRRALYELTNRYDFKDYVKFQEKNNPALWSRETVESFIMDAAGNNKVDFLGKFENLQSDFDRVCDRLNIPKIKIPRLNISRRRHYTHYYDEASREIIAKAFKWEIEHSGYRFEKPDWITSFRKFWDTRRNL